MVRFKQQWEEEYREWSQRRLDGTRYVYLWADGIYLKAGLGKEKTALLVVIGVNEKGEKELLAMAEGYRKWTESWRDVLGDLKQRDCKIQADHWRRFPGALVRDVFVQKLSHKPAAVEI